MPTDTASPPSPLTDEIGPMAALNCVVLCLDNKGHITFLNPFGLDFFGYQPQEFIGRPAMATLFPEGAPYNLPSLHRDKSSSSDHPDKGHQRCRCRRKNGDLVWLIWSCQPFVDADKNLKGHLLVGHHITDQMRQAIRPHGERSRQAETAQRYQSHLKNLTADLEDIKKACEDSKKKLKEKQDRYQLFSEVTTEGILFHDNGIALDANEAFMAMVECSRDQIIGMDMVRRFISTEDIHRVQQALASSDELVYEVTARSSNGRTFPVELTSRPGRIGDTPCRVVCVRDISHQKEAERQMIQAQKMEAIGSLASNIAHDFNNMLAGIQGNVEIIRHQLPPASPHQKELTLINQIVERGARLCGQILGYARGGQSEISEIDLNGLVKDTLEMFGRANTRVKIRTELREDIPSVKGDRTQIEQVLLNLMINAMHAMPAGGNLTIETKPTVLTSDTKRPYQIIPGDYTMIVVQDTGHGMDQATRKKIFEPFFTTKDRNQGTGLGLASTYGIVKNHNGYIDVSTEPGVGSRFSVLLPACSETKKTTPADTTIMESDAQTVMMVDDEADFLLLGRQMLSLLGYSPITADNCKTALTLFEQTPGKVELVIMDMIMPDGAVQETIQRLRELDSTVRILLSSGHSQNGEIGRQLMQHCDGFIQKPFRLASLSQKIKELIGVPENEDQ